MRPSLIDELVRDFSSLPGVGPKTAEKYVYALLRTPHEFRERFASHLASSKTIRTCKDCFHVTDAEYCTICSNPNRTPEIICVVADSQDVTAIEKTKKFFGRYHVLRGLISPLDGIAAKHLTIEELQRRINQQGVQEIILAFDQTTQGETTTLALSKILKNFPVTISVLARGLPVGSDLEYADDITLGSALEGRRKI